MKNIIIYICSLAVLFSVVSCGKTPLSDPREEPDFYFKFKQKTGEQNDFFTINNTYLPDSVKIRYESEPYQKFYNRFFNNAYVFTIGGHKNTHTFYIDYKNGDIDTLSNTYVSDVENPVVENMKKLTWYFNGKIIKEFDFENNTGLKDELYSKNNGISNAIIIDVLK